MTNKETFAATYATAFVESFESAKKQAELLNHAVDITTAVLKAFPTGAMGLTPDDVKASDTYKAAKKSFNTAFARLRAFNAVFVKQYKKELAAEKAKGE